MKKLYAESQAIDVPIEFISSWNNVLTMPKFIEKAKEHNDGGGGFVYLRCINDGKRVPLCKPHMCYADLKKAIRDSKTKECENVFVAYDSVINETAAIIGMPEEKNVCLISDISGKRFYFGESKAVIEESGSGVTKEFIIIDAMLKKRPTKLYFPILDFEDVWKMIRDLKRSEYVSFNGMKVENRFKSGKDIVEEYVYFVTEYKIFEDSFGDIGVIIPKINSLVDISPFMDLSNMKPMYSDQVTKLILYDVFYVKEANPVFNLIVYGEGGSGKSTATMVHGLVFSSMGRYIDMTASTVAGLVVSYGDGAKPGMLISPIEYTKVIDELFRRSTGDAAAKGKADPTSEITFLLERLMGILLRDPSGVSGSGKGSLKYGDSYMRDSFLASDNMVGEVRNAFCSKIRDGAIVRRFSFLRVTDQDKVGVQNANVRPSAHDLFDAAISKYESMGLGLGSIRRFAKWFRKVAANVQVSGQKSKLVAESVQRDVLKDVWNEKHIGQSKLGDNDFDDFFLKWSSIQNLVPNFEALVRCCSVTRCVEDKKDEGLPKIEVVDADYDEAAILFKRLFIDAINIYHKGVSDWMSAGSLERTYRGGQHG